METTHCIQGKPHRLEMLSPLPALPWLIPIFSLSFGRRDMTSIAVSCAAAAVFSIAILAVSIRRTVGRSWMVEDNVLHFTRGISDKRDMTLRLDRISSSEIADNPLYSLFGGTRVRLYSGASPKPVFSMIMPKKQAAELINLTATTFGAQKSVKPRYLIPKKYSALLSAITSRETLIPLFASAMLCLLGWGKIELYITAAALWLFALLHTALSTFSECRMSVCHVNSGYAIQTGFFGGHRIFIPDRAIIGMIETRNPIAALCGAGKLQLLCAGGRRITCIGWYDGENSEQAACRMIGCVGKSFARISDRAAIKKDCHRQIALCAVFSALAWRITAALPQDFRAAVTAGFVLITAVMLLHSVTQIHCADELGVSLANGSVRAGGMNMMMCKSMTLHLGQVAIVKIHRNFPDRLRGTCTAEIIPKGRERGVKCRFLPYERFLAACDRII